MSVRVIAGVLIPNFVIIGQSIHQTHGAAVRPHGLFNYVLERSELREALPLTCRDCGCPLFDHNA